MQLILEQFRNNRITLQEALDQSADKCTSTVSAEVFRWASRKLHEVVEEAADRAKEAAGEEFESNSAKERNEARKEGIEAFEELLLEETSVGEALLEKLAAKALEEVTE